MNIYCMFLCGKGGEGGWLFMVWMEIGGHAHDTPVRSCDFVQHRQAALGNGISNKTKGISPKKKKLNRNLVSRLYYE